MQEKELKKQAAGMVGGLASSGEVLICNPGDPRASVFYFSAAHCNNYDGKGCTSFGYGRCYNSTPSGIRQGQRLLYSLLPIHPQVLIVPRRARSAIIGIISRTFLQLSSRRRLGRLRKISTLIDSVSRIYLYVSATSYVPILYCSAQQGMVTTVRTK